MGSIVDRQVPILIFSKGVDGILAAIFCFAGCDRLGAEGFLVSRWQVMKDQRSLLKGNPAGGYAGDCPVHLCQIDFAAVLFS
jgi:hypothetical protein